MAKTKKTNLAAPVQIDRRKIEKHDRRKVEIPVAVERRAKVNRRRQIDPTTCEREYTDPEIEFMHAMEKYKRASGRMFPTCSEVLEVLIALGYEKKSASSLSSSCANACPCGEEA